MVKSRPIHTTFYCNLKQYDQCNFYGFFLIIVSHCLVLGHGPGPKLVPFFGPGPWSRSRSRHISGPGLSPSPGLVIFWVPALVPEINNWRG